jgi:DNA-binding response OmpR family regulator
VVLDLGLPDRDGLELVDRIRGTDPRTGRIDPELPLLVLSGRAAELDRLRGFERGVDDYLVKPFSYAELRVRIEALLRRTRVRPQKGRLRAGTLELDPISRQVWVQGQRVSLSNKEFALLRTLAAEPTRVFTREELLRSVWGFTEPARTRTLDSHASRLRQKLGLCGDSYVVNVWGVGYRLADGTL